MSGKVRRRKKRESEFSTVYNSPFQRKDMSAKAKGILIYLMTLPEDWTLYKNELYTHFKDGRDSINSGIEELEKFGYFVSIQHREQGRFVYDYIFNDEPYQPEEIADIYKEYGIETAPDKDSHRSGFSATVKPQRANRSGKPATTKELSIKDLKTKDLKTKDIENPIPRPLDIYSLNIPTELKIYFSHEKSKGLGWGESYLYDLQAFYNMQQPEYIRPYCSPEDYEYLNDIDFCNMVKTVYSEVRQPIENMQGLLKSFTLSRLAFKKEKVLGAITIGAAAVPTSEENPKFYNWLEERD